MKNILFVCTGNTCRSPMAQGFLKRLCLEILQCRECIPHPLPVFQLEQGDPGKHKFSKCHALDWSIDISGHRARNITEDDIHNSFLVLAMTSSHRDILTDYFPEEHTKYIH